MIDLPATEVPSERRAAPGGSAGVAEPPRPAAGTAPRRSPSRRRGQPAAVGDRSPEQLSWAHASAGIAGAAGGAAGGCCCCGSAARSRRGRSRRPISSPRLAAIEKQLNDLAARPAPAGRRPQGIVDRKAIDDVAARLTRLESAQATPRAPVTDPVVLGRLNAAESATKSLADNAAALSRRAEATDAALRDTNGRIDKLTATPRRRADHGAFSRRRQRPRLAARRRGVGAAQRGRARRSVHRRARHRQAARARRQCDRAA